VVDCFLVPSCAVGIRLSRLVSSPLDMPIYRELAVLCSKGIAVGRTEGVTAGRSALALLDCFKAVRVVHMPTHFLLAAG